MRRSLLSLGILSLGATAAATGLALAPAASPADGCALASAGCEQPDVRYARMPANDKEAHVPIWFTLSISGVELATGFSS